MSDLDENGLVRKAAIEFLLHRGEQPMRVTRRGAELWEDYAPSISAAIRAYKAAEGVGEPVAWTVMHNTWENPIISWTDPTDAWAGTPAKITPLYAAPQPSQSRGEVVESAWSLIVAERRRQISTEGWNADHDAQHTSGEILQAAVIYLWHGTPKGSEIDNGTPPGWPWDDKWWKPRGRQENLIRAGALCLAEHDRLTLAGLPTGPADHKLGLVLRELSALSASPQGISIAPKGRHLYCEHVILPLMGQGDCPIGTVTQEAASPQREGWVVEEAEDLDGTAMQTIGDDVRPAPNGEAAVVDAARRFVELEAHEKKMGWTPLLGFYADELEPLRNAVDALPTPPKEG